MSKKERERKKERKREKERKKERKKKRKKNDVVVAAALSLFSLSSLKLNSCSPLAHAPRPRGCDRLLAELLHGDDVDAAHGAWLIFIVEVF